jgi:hypothetical protein
LNKPHGGTMMWGDWKRVEREVLKMILGHARRADSRPACRLAFKIFQEHAGLSRANPNNCQRHRDTDTERATKHHCEIKKKACSNLQHTS